MKDDTALPDNPTAQRVNELNFLQGMLEDTAFLCLPRFPAIRRVDNYALDCLFRRVALSISDRPSCVFVNEKYVVEARLPIRPPNDFPVARPRFPLGSTANEYSDENTNQDTSKRAPEADTVPFHLKSHLCVFAPLR